MKQWLLALKMNLSRRYTFLISGFFIFVASFFTERLWLYPEVINLHNGKYLITKLILAVLLLFLMEILFKISCNLSDEEFRGYISIFFKVFVSYFGLMMIFLLTTWPGVWRWDEFWVLEGSKSLTWNSYQHYFTSIFYCLILLLVPIPTMVIVVQLIIISMIIAYVTTEIYIMTGKRKMSFLIVVSFLLLPVIDSNLYPIRLSLYAFIELLFYFNIALILRRGMKNAYLIMYVICSILLLVWRSEGVYYILFAPAVLVGIFLKSKDISIKKMIMMIAIIIIGGFFLKTVQDELLHRTIGDQNTVISTLRFLNDYVNTKEEFYVNENNPDEVNINKVVDLSVLKEHGDAAVWREDVVLIKKDYSREEYKNYLNSYFKLIIKNPMKFLKVQAPLFFIANGMSAGGRFVSDSAGLYNKDSNIYNQEIIKEIFTSNAFTSPINEDLRANAITLMELNKSRRLVKVMYNSLIPYVIIVFIWFYFLFKRKWLVTLIGLGYMVKVPLLILIAPGSAFMYYYPSYLIGWVVIVMAIIWWYKNVIELRIRGK